MPKQPSEAAMPVAPPPSPDESGDVDRKVRIRSAAYAAYLRRGGKPGDAVAGVAALGEPAFLSEVPLTTAERRAVRGKERTQNQREEYPERSIGGCLSC